MTHIILLQVIKCFENLKTNYFSDFVIEEGFVFAVLPQQAK